MAAKDFQSATKWLTKPLTLFRSRHVLHAAAVVLAAIALVVIAARGGKWLTIHRLATRIQTADDSTAGQLVRELRAFGPAAYPALVAAAGSDRTAVALTARSEIEDLVDTWQQSAYLHPTTFKLGAEPIPLARALEQEVQVLTVSGRRWARRVLTSLLDLAQQQEFEDRIELIAVCDRALSSLPADDPSPQFESDVDYALTLAPASQVSIATGTMVEEPRTAVTPPIVASDRAAPTEADTAEPSSPANEDAPLASEAPVSVWNPNWTARAVGDPTDEGRTPGVMRVPAQSASTTRLAPPPTMPEDSHPELNVGPVRRIDDRNDQKLMQLLAMGDQQQQAAAAKALLARGYGHATPLDARMMLSPSPADRMLLVDRAMTSARLESQTWLWRLAHDASGEVRSAAVAGITTSGDRGLIEATLKLVLRDTDPRVAEQASMLRSLLK